MLYPLSYEGGPTDPSPDDHGRPRLARRRGPCGRCRRRFAVDAPDERLRTIVQGHRPLMTIVVILVILALIFGVGSVLEGLVWGFLIVVALLVAAAVYGAKKLGR